MAMASSRIVIHATADAIWQVISDFGAADQYLGGIDACTLEGEGIGAVRTLTSFDGSTVVERLEMGDAATWQLRYFLLTDTPFVDCLTSMTLRDLMPNRTELTWSATFEVDGIPESEAVALLEGALAENCRVLKQFMEIERPNVF